MDFKVSVLRYMSLFDLSKEKPWGTNMGASLAFQPHHHSHTSLYLCVAKGDG